MKTKQNVAACNTCLPFGKSSENWSSEAGISKHDEKSDSRWKGGREYWYVFVTWQSH